MKKFLILLPLLTLAACGNSPENQNVTGHQPLQSIQVGTPAPAPTVTEPVTTPAPLPAPVDEVLVFASQDEFVQHMFDELTRLEGTLVMLDANLSEALNSDSPESLLNLREFILSGIRDDQAKLESLTPYNDAVTNLHQYVTQAFHYNAEHKAAEFDIFNTDSLEERSQLLTANSENERQAARYIALAWEELSALSNSPIYQK